MKRLAVFSLLFMIPFLPVYSQEMKANKSLQLETVEVPFEAFNIVSHNATVTKLGHEHITNWQLEIENKLVYANPNGNAVVRLYDGSNLQKFIEIGMGSLPDLKFWVAVQNEDTGYVVIHLSGKDGWKPGKIIIAQHSSNGGFSVNNGERIVVSNLDLAGFTIRDFSVYGLESPTDPPTASAGKVVLNFLSGNPAENTLYYFPVVLVVAIGGIIMILLKTKKRV